MAHDKDTFDLNEIKQALAELTNTVNDQAKVLRNIVTNKVQDSAQYGQQKVEEVKSVIEEKPLQAVGVAALVGLLVGCILARK